VPVALAGGAMGLINALGNLGGFAGPYIGGWLQDASGGSFLSTAVVLAVSMLLGGLVLITLRRHADKPTVARLAAAARRAPASPVRSSAVKSRQHPRPAHDS
jgi:MFS family permease